MKRIDSGQFGNGGRTHLRAPAMKLRGGASSRARAASVGRKKRAKAGLGKPFVGSEVARSNGIESESFGRRKRREMEVRFDPGSSLRRCDGAALVTGGGGWQVGLACRRARGCRATDQRRRRGADGEEQPEVGDDRWVSLVSGRERGALDG